MRRDFLIRAASIAGCYASRLSEARMLMEAAGGIDAVFSSTKEQLQQLMRERGESNCVISDRLMAKKTAADAARDIDWATDHGLEILSIEDSRYPSRLRQCPDAPILLYSSGGFDLNGARMIAIVGTRAATENGRRYCNAIVEGLSKCSPAPVVVSGLALGIDTFAHTAALKYGLETVAVMGTGFETIYPPSNQNLAERILQQGALVTEFTPFTPSYPVNFVRRNRIIAGLCDCVLVVESKKKGGGLITAQLGMDYDRSVFAVPGRIDDNTFRGCNNLIESNIAGIVTGPESIIRAMGWEPGTLPLGFDRPRMRPCSGVAGEILRFLCSNPPSDADTIAAALSLSVAEIALPLVELEMEGRIYRISGDRFGAN